MIHTVSWAYICNRLYDEAIEYSHKILQVNPKFTFGEYNLARAYLLKGNYEEAIKLLENTTGILGRGSGNLGYAYAKVGKREKALEIKNRLLPNINSGDETILNLAIVFVGLGQKEEALDMLEIALKERSNWLLHLIYYPIFDPLRNEPRFESILRKMGIGQ